MENMETEEYSLLFFFWLISHGLDIIFVLLKKISGWKLKELRADT